MAVNRYKKHLTVFLEDQPYRELVNGVKTLPHFCDHVLDVKRPCGGWKKDLNTLEDNLALLNDRASMHALLLMDFDNKYQSRRAAFEEVVHGQPCQPRVFMLGIDKKESEDLKATLQKSNNESLGKVLIAPCPNGTSPEWQNHHLTCNEPEIDRMRSAGVLQWLFS